MLWRSWNADVRLYTYLQTRQLAKPKIEASFIFGYCVSVMQQHETLVTAAACWGFSALGQIAVRHLLFWVIVVKGVQVTNKITSWENVPKYLQVKKIGSKAGNMYLGGAKQNQCIYMVKAMCIYTD